MTYSRLPMKSALAIGIEFQVFCFHFCAVLSTTLWLKDHFILFSSGPTQELIHQQGWDTGERENLSSFFFFPSCTKILSKLRFLIPIDSNQSCFAIYSLRLSDRLLYISIWKGSSGLGWKITLSEDVKSPCQYAIASGRKSHLCFTQSIKHGVGFDYINFISLWNKTNHFIFNGEAKLLGGSSGQMQSTTLWLIILL